LTQSIFTPDANEPGLGVLDAALRAVVAAQPARDKIKEAQKRKELPRGAPSQWIDLAREKGVLSQSEADLLRTAERARDAAVQVDSFPRAELERARP
jgi:acyl-CoA dehydrogenase